MRCAVRYLSVLALSLAFCALLSPPEARAQTHYKVVQSTGASVVAGNDFTEVAAANCADAQSPNNDCTAPVVLPFNFVFYDQTFPAGATVFAGTNGNLQFGSNSNSYGGLAGVCFPLTQFVNAMYPHFADIQTDGPGEGIFTSVSGAEPNRVFNVEWRASYEFGTPGSLNFQVRLYEGTGPVGQKFDFVYGPLAGSISSAPGDSTRPAVGSQCGGGGCGGAGRFTQVSSPCGGLLGGGIRPGMMLSFVGANEGPFISGRVTDADLRPVSGATVTLGGDSSQQRVTGADGTYSFTGLALNGSYSVTISDAANSLYYPRQRAFSPNPQLGPPFNGPKIVNFARTPAVQPHDVLISEFRFRGPHPDIISDDFVELYNNTNSAIVVNTSDNSSGWLLLAPNNEFYFIRSGTVIPARRHFLVSGSGYSSLYLYAPGDGFFSGDMPSDSGVALFKTAAVDPSNMADAMSKRLDAAGFASAGELYREGAGLAPIGNVPGEYSFVRKLLTGTPQETDDNAADFAFVSTTAANFGAVQAVRGAPGPQNLGGPSAGPARNILNAPLDATASTFAAPNRVRDASDTGPNNVNGTLRLSRRFRNQTGAKITHLRFRVVDITSSPAAGGQADLRALTSTDTTVTTSDPVTCATTPGATSATAPCTVPLAGTRLEEAPDQGGGGALNSSLKVDSVSAASPLLPDSSIDVQFLFGVQTAGNYRFGVIVEALPDGGSYWLTQGNTETAAVTPDVFSLQPVADAYVKGSTPDTNFGTVTELQVKRTFTPGNGKGRQAYMRFDTSPAAGPITRATLRVYGRLSAVTAENANIPLAVFPVSTAWGELTLTWNNKPAPNVPVELGRVNVPDDVARWYEFDVTTFIQQERAAGRPLTGVLLRNMLRGGIGDFYTAVNSREAATGQPVLVIEK